MSMRLKGPRILVLRAFLFFAALFAGTMAHSAPEIGMAFPPVSNQEQRAFSIKALRDLNVRHIRIEENWARRGAHPTRKDFAPLVQRIDELHDAGLKILLTVAANAPKSLCAKSNKYGCAIKDSAPFEDYLKQLLNEVGPKLDAIQFGNEWDHQFAGSAEEFVALHQRFAATVRAVDPGLTIVLGGITSRAPIASLVCHQGRAIEVPWPEPQAANNAFCGKEAKRNTAAIAMVKHVLRSSDFDVADVHLYDVPDIWKPAYSWVGSLTKKPIWVTEFGGPHPSLEPKNATYHAKRLTLYLDAIRSLNAPRAYYFKLTDDPNSYHGKSGLFTRQGRPKPAFLVFKERN